MHKLTSILAEKFIADLIDTHMRLKQAIVEAQAKYQDLANARHSKTSHLLA